jgi:hypothetical protein
MSYRHTLGLARPEPLASGSDAPREAIRQRLAARTWSADELASQFGVTRERLLDHWKSERPVPAAMRLKAARLLEARAEALERLAAELRSGIWSGPRPPAESP